MKSDEIREVASWDDLHAPGNWLRTQTTSEAGESTFAGIVIVCVCGQPVSLSVRVHTFVSLAPLTITPSIGHYNDDGSRTLKCHYFIRDGQYVAA